MISGTPRELRIFVGPQPGRVDISERYVSAGSGNSQDGSDSKFPRAAEGKLGISDARVSLAVSGSS